MTNSSYRHDLEHATRKGSDGEAGSGLLAFGPDRSTLVPEDIPLLRAARGESFSDDLIWIGPPGDQRALSVSARPVSEPDDFTGSVIAYSDVTQLINAVAAKDDFLANVSHELRTPPDLHHRPPRPGPGRTGPARTHHGGVERCPAQFRKTPAAGR